MLLDIDVELIDPNPLAPRSIYTAEMIQARADDLRTQGQHDPIHVTPNPEVPGRYIICDGWTRVQACRIHGTLKTLRAEIHPDLTGVESAIFGYQQNEGRKQHSDYDRAQFFEKLKDSGLSAAEISRLTGIPENRLSMYKSLARLPSVVLQQVQKAPELFGYNAGAQLARLCPANAADSDRGVMRAAKLAEAFSAGDRTFKWLKTHCDDFLTHKPRVLTRTGVSLRYPEGYLRGRGDTLQLELRLGTPEVQEALLEDLRHFLRDRGIVENPAGSDREVSPKEEAAG
jgi:ParB family chromosome partitioning protein